MDTNNEREYLKDVTVYHCARCGQDHEHLDFIKFKKPVVDTCVWSHWVLCPVTGDPILLTIEDEQV